VDKKYIPSTSDSGDYLLDTGHYQISLEFVQGTYEIEIKQLQFLRHRDGQRMYGNSILKIVWRASRAVNFRNEFNQCIIQNVSKYRNNTWS